MGNLNVYENVSFLLLVVRALLSLPKRARVVCVYAAFNHVQIGPRIIASLFFVIVCFLFIFY